MGNNASKSPNETSGSAAGSHVPSRSSSKTSSSRHRASINSQGEVRHPRKQETSSPRALPVSQHADDDKAMGNQQSTASPSGEEANNSKPRAAPVKVPHRGSDSNRQRGPDTQFEPSGPPRDPDFVPRSNFGLPPRLPLPIGEELHTPGSPIIDAQHSPIPHDDASNGAISRQNSSLSNNTLEDDELGDGLHQHYEGGSGTVPTTIHWKHAGNQVFLTGTFTNWDRKYRMNKDPATGFLSTRLQLPPGTHHVKFIVDGEMQLSDDLPTAVDFANILVNYIEVSADDIPKAKSEETREGVKPPEEISEGVAAQDHEPAAVRSALDESEAKGPTVYWGRELPPYLDDYDEAEHTNRFSRAARVVNDFPPPPGLPLFLGKSILNGTTPMKDDSSVLNMPNHTVLNHLATSSIKNEVLATSITIRYLHKYVTTIVYKPIESDP